MLARMPPLSPEDLRLAEGVARAFATHFEAAGKASPPGPAAHPALDARRWLLGPATVWRGARALAGGASFTKRIADIGLRIRRGLAESKRGARLESVDSSAAGAIVATAFAAWQHRDGERVVLQIGPRCSPWLEASRAALEPLISRGDLALEEVDGGTLAPRVSRAVVAPYFYSPADLRRVAEALVLERAVPSPHAEGGLDIYVARGWDQRYVFADQLTAAQAALGATGDRAIELDVDTAADLLEQTRHAGEPADAIAAFVYPMLRERPEVEAGLQALLADFNLAIVNHTPAVAWAIGVGSSPVSILVEVDQRMRGLGSARAMTRRARFEECPSIGRALGAVARGWAG